MPTFDFNIQTSPAANSNGVGTRSVNGTFSAGGDNVTFTMSSTDADNKTLSLGASSSPFGFQINDNGDDDAFVMNFAGNSTAGLKGISGTTGNPIVVGNGQFAAGTWNVSFLTSGGGTVFGGTMNGAGDTVSSTLSNVTGIKFTSISGAGSFDRLEIDSLSYNALTTCYCAGTRIKTPDGFKLVEDLVAGERICTPTGTTTVQWLGKQAISTLLTHPAKINPIRILAGALAEGVPSRDLFVSPDHAIHVNGVLYNAIALVNGSTITQVRNMPKAGFTYYHVETERHELILAEDCAAESYLDNPSREVFDNGVERADAAVIQEMELPRVSSRRLVPESVIAQIERRTDTFLKLAG